MKKLLLIFILLISLYPTTTIQAISSDNLFFATYNTENGNWANMTITNRVVNISSNDPAYFAVEFELLSDPIPIIVSEAIKENFFELNRFDANPNMIVALSHFGLSNEIAVNGSLSYNFIDMIIDLRDRVIDPNEQVWPVDMQVMVLESYPEQYSVSFIALRFNDFWANVLEMQATLVVGDYDIFANYLVDPNGNITYLDTIDISLAYGGESKVFSFDTFSVGTQYSPSDLHFYVIFDNGLYLHYFVGLEMIAKGLSNLNITELTPIKNQNNSSLIDTNDEFAVSLPWNYMAIAVLSIVIINRKRIIKK